MKRYVCVLFAVLLMLSLGACGENETATTTTADVTTTTAATTTTASATATEIDGTTVKVTTTSKPIDKTIVPKTTTTVATTSSKVTTTTKAPTTTAPKPTVYDLNVFYPDSEYTLADDGSLDVNMLAVEGVYGCDVSNYLVSGSEFEMNYAIPEADVLAAMRKTFVVSDELFAKIKAKGSYQMFGPDKLTYENGQFLLTEYDGWGGGTVYSNHAAAYADDGKGTLTVYHSLAEMDWDTNEYNHNYYYAVTYTYSGTDPLAVYGANDKYENGFIRCENKSVLDSLRVKAIKKVASVDGYTAVKTEK